MYTTVFSCSPLQKQRLCKYKQILKTAVNLEFEYCKSSWFSCLRDYSQGGIKICPYPSVCLSVCLSVRPSVRPSVRSSRFTLKSLCNQFLPQFKWIFLKPCLPVVVILKMCMWVFGGARINFDRITAYRT